MTDEQPDPVDPDDAGGVSRGGKIAALVAGAVILVGGGVAAGYALFSDDDGDAAVTGETSATTSSPDDDEMTDDEMADETPDEPTDDADEPDDDTDQPDDGQDSASSSADVAQAVAAALARQSGIATTADLDDGGNWEIDILADDDSWHEVVVDGATFDVVSAQPDDDDDQDEVSDARGAQILLVDAAETAAAEAGGDVTSIDLDDEFDDSPRLTWDVEVAMNGSSRDVEIAADTGEVLANTADDD